MRNGYREIYAPWRDAVARRRTIGMSATAGNGSVLVNVRTELPELAYYDLNYLIRPDGSITVEVSFQPFSDFTPPLPRLGLITGLSGDLQHVAGTGGAAKTLDRKTGAKIGRYELAVGDLHHPMFPPTERQPDRRALGAIDLIQQYRIRFTADTVLQFNPRLHGRGRGECITRHGCASDFINCKRPS
jgi:hypothetical protein